MTAKRLRYTPEARADLNDIGAYLTEAANKALAVRMIQRIRVRIKSAKDFPQSGAPRPDIGSSCRLVTEQPYMIYYTYRGGDLIVLRILHAARDRDAIMRGDAE